MKPEDIGEHRSAARASQFTATLLTFILAFSLAAQALEPADSLRQNLMALWPQGWTFFTRAIAEPSILVYNVSGDGKATDTTERQTTADGMWGLRRTSYVQTAEVSELLPVIPTGYWIACEGLAQECLAQATASVPLRVVNAFAHPMLCGLVALVEEPMSSRALASDVETASRAVLLDVACA